MGHRLHRDFRITTHCALVARAFGADGIIISGDEDADIIKSVEKINSSWGGKFQARYDKKWRSVIENWKRDGGYVILTTMYGINLPDAEKIIRKDSAGKDILLVVGSEKMPSEMFQAANLNVAVSNQPHSEVAAIAMVLDRIFNGKELQKNFRDARMKIRPQEKGKRVVPA
jgi:tRNA (cytidine56-2'-O)-methyltransferase